MKVQILGSGCTKCKLLEQHARDAVSSLSLDADVVKISEMEKIVEMGVMSTPALAIDGVIKSMGRLLTKDQIIEILKGSK